MPMSRRGPVTGLPASTTLPEDGGSSPAMIFSSVDLPQPLEPMTEAKLALAQGQVDPVERLDVARARSVLVTPRSS